MAAPTLSERQQKVRAFVADFMFAQGYPPTQRDIQLGLGLKSRATVDFHLRALARKGILVVRSRARRAIRLTGQNCAYCRRKRAS